MINNLNSKVPRYFKPYVNDCFHNTYSAVLQFMGFKPEIILADYLSFMYDQKNEYIGVNYFYRYNNTVEFSEEELNTSLEFVYFPATSNFNPESGKVVKVRYEDRFNINMYISDDSSVAYSRLKELLDSGKPVIAAVDLYYMSYHRAFGKEHGLHCVVITGYNEKEGYFELFDKFALSSSDFDGKLPIDEVIMGRKSDNPLPWGDRTNRPVRNLWMEINVDNAFSIKAYKLINILEESFKRMSGQNEVLGHKCGLEMLDLFIKDLLLKKAKDPDAATINWFRSYLNSSFKNISRSRKRFVVFLEEIHDMLPEHLVNEVSGYLEESAKHWDICANIALKLGIRKSMELTDDLVEHLGMVRDLENCVLERLGSLFACRV